MTKQSFESLVNQKTGLISRKIFFDEEIYKKELKNIFTKCWLFLGHVSQIPNPGDFITNYMGEDPVIVCRDGNGDVRAFLNSCRHRGMRVCRLDRGNTAEFVCSFHGWTYGTDGALIGVPFVRETYGDTLDKEKWGLVGVPRVSEYGGMIFGCWDNDAISLDEYLGDLRWYLDVFLTRPLGGIEFIKGQQRYRCKSNWKLAGENFSGDTYHLPTSHASVYDLDIRQISPITYKSKDILHSVNLPNGHGLTGINFKGDRYRADLEEAKAMGPDVVEYIEECRRRLEEGLSKLQADVYALSFGHIFPNLSHNDFSALRPMGFYLWHPKGPLEMESWQWCGVDRDAPEALKEMIRVDFTRTQAVAGIAAQDDTENFEQVSEAARGVIGQEYDFNFQMGLAKELLELEGSPPGRISDYYSEKNQNNFYGYWATKMGEG